MKILYIVNTLPTKQDPDHDPFVQSQIESVRNEGINVDIYNIDGTKSKMNYLNAIREVREMIKENKYDIVHGHYVYAGWIAALQRISPSIVSFMGSDLYGTCNANGKLTLRGRFDNLLSRYLQLFSDGIIVKSLKMMQHVIKKKQAVVLPNGVDFDKFKDMPMQKAREAIGLARDKIYVLFAGHHLVPNKCFPLVEEAVEILKTLDSRYEVLLASGLPHGDVPLYMNAANVLVLPSRREGSPNVVKEALACNLPVAATDVGDVRELIGDIPGCMVVERTPKAFAYAIEKIVSADIPFQGRKAIEHLRIENIAKQLIDFYHQVIDNWQGHRNH